MIVAPFLLAAQMGGSPPKVMLSVPKAVEAGKPYQATLTVTFASGLHSYQNPVSEDYQIPVTVKLKDAASTLVSVLYPKGTDMVLPGETKPSKVYSGTIKILLSLKAGMKSAPLTAVVAYQECNETSCFPPSSVEAKASLVIKSKQ